MKKIKLYTLLVAGLAVFASCNHDRSPNGNYDPNNPGYEYAPEGDMYYSVPFQAMTQYEGSTNPYNKDSMNLRKPAPGTIARGKLMYYYQIPNTPQGYEQSASLKNPYEPTKENLDAGKHAYEMYCWQCHGMQGQNDGSLMAAGKFPKPFWGHYNSDYIRALPEGKIFHVITYGKNLMGPHGPIVSPDKRWKIAMYIKDVLAQLPSENASADAGDKATSETK